MCSYFDPRLTKLNTTNQPGSTGEVLKYIQGIGGLAVGLDYIQCIPWTAPGYKHTADIFQAIEYTIFLNKEGKRYVAEDARRDVIRDATWLKPIKRSSRYAIQTASIRTTSITTR